MKGVYYTVTNYRQVEVMLLDYLGLSDGLDALLDANLDLQNGCFLKGSRNDVALHEEFKTYEEKKVLVLKLDGDYLDFLIESLKCKTL